MALRDTWNAPDFGAGIRDRRVSRSIERFCPRHRPADGRDSPIVVLVHTRRVCSVRRARKISASSASQPNDAVGRPLSERAAPESGPLLGRALARASGGSAYGFSFLFRISARQRRSSGCALMSCVLTVDGVNKRYPTYRSNLQRFANWFGASFSPVVEFWASRDISFQVRKGEAVALIGQNGAGKSTLLKMVTGTVRPTSGKIHVSGRISAILELGLGFNPEFTGRQNVHQAGGLMGFSQQDLDGLMPAIEAFAEIGEFFDQPVRVYSSGMQARLAFALATAQRPDILIVDEVLSVGDSYFQHKSFDRIRQFKDQGTAILLVTHSLGDVKALCDRVILLDKGSVLKDGPPDEVVDYYNAMVADRENSSDMTIEQERDGNGWLRTRSGTFDTIVRKVELLDTVSSMAVSTAVVGQKLTLRVDLQVQNPVPKLILGVMLRDRTGHVVWGTNTSHTNQTLFDQNAGQRIRFDTEFDCNLGPGSFSFTTAITGSDTHLDANYDWQDNALVFDVINTSLPFFVGSNAIPAKIKIAKVD